MNFDSATKKVSADKRKGTVKIGCTSDGEKPFTWTPEGSSAPEFEYAVMQGDATFELSKQMKRVVILRFECDETRYIFWLQEKDVNKDNEIVTKVQEIIDFDVEQLMHEEPPQPPKPQQTQPSSSQNTSSNVPSVQQSLQNTSLFGENFQNMFNNMLQQQQRGQGNNNNDRMMQQLLQQYQNQGKRKETPSFMEVLTKEELYDLVSDPEVAKELFEHLPEDQQDIVNLRENLISPQFQQALESLEKALNSEEGAAVLVSLGLDATNFMQTLDGSDSFYKAILKWAEEKNKKQ